MQPSGSAFRPECTFFVWVNASAYYLPDYLEREGAASAAYVVGDGAGHAKQILGASTGEPEGQATNARMPDLVITVHSD